MNNMQPYSRITKRKKANMANNSAKMPNVVVLCIWAVDGNIDEIW